MTTKPNGEAVASAAQTVDDILRKDWRILKPSAELSIPKKVKRGRKHDALDTPTRYLVSKEALLKWGKDVERDMNSYEKQLKKISKAGGARCDVNFGEGEINEFISLVENAPSLPDVAAEIVPEIVECCLTLLVADKVGMPHDLEQYRTQTREAAKTETDLWALEIAEAVLVLHGADELIKEIETQRDTQMGAFLGFSPSAMDFVLGKKELKMPKPIYDATTEPVYDEKPTSGKLERMVFAAVLKRLR